jgi:hypothetical protein
MPTRVERPPYTSYAPIMATFSGGLAAAGAFARLLRRDAQCQTAAANDFLQAGFTALSSKANQLEAES